MERLSEKRCIVGEGPVWHPSEKKLYYVNGFAEEICVLDPQTGAQTVRKFDFSVGAFGFGRAGEVLISCSDGVFYLHEDGSRAPLPAEGQDFPYHCNDAKVGPDGRFYVGTQSRKRLGLGDEIDGKLYSIDKNGIVRVLLEGMRLSNGFDWSMDEKRFYHTDSDTRVIREYDFDRKNGDLSFTGREVYVPGVDGFATGQDDRLYVGCWGRGHVAVVDTHTMEIERHIPVPVKIPVSCCFMGERMEKLAVVTASYRTDPEQDPFGGCTFVTDVGVCGREPYLFG